MLHSDLYHNTVYYFESYHVYPIFQKYFQIAVGVVVVDLTCYVHCSSSSHAHAMVVFHNIWNKTLFWIQTMVVIKIPTHIVHVVQLSYSIRRWMYRCCCCGCWDDSQSHRNLVIIKDRAMYESLLVSMIHYHSHWLIFSLESLHRHHDRVGPFR